MKWIISLLAVLVFTTSVHALELQDPEEYRGNDTQMYLNGEGGDRRVATGVCIGPFKEVVSDSGSKIGGFLSSCALMAFNPGAQTDEAVPMAGVQLFDMAGISFSVVVDPFDNSFFTGIGISVLDVARQLSDD